MLDLLVKSAVRRKIVGIFGLNSHEEFYSRQVAIEIGESPHAVGLELDYLVKGGLLKKAGRGGRIYYRWNPDHPFASLLEKTVEKMRRLGNPEMKALPDVAHRRRIEENLHRIVEEIREYYDPEKIIVFGSAATGKAGPDSDIDMVVVRKTNEPFFNRGGKMAEHLNYDVGLDLLVYTPLEFEIAAKEKPFFREEIVKKGRVLYDRVA